MIITLFRLSTHLKSHLTIFVIIFICTSVHAQEDDLYHGSKNRTFDLIHTQLDVSFDWENQYLIGQATLTLKPYFFSQSELILDAKGMDIESVSFVDNLTTPLGFEYDGAVMTINLGHEVSRMDTIAIQIKYVSKPNERLVGGSDAITSDKGLYFINPKGLEKFKPRQIWTQGETESNSIWFPTIDAPNERCTQEISITVQDNFKTLSNGLLTSQKINQDGSRTDIWTMDQPHAPYLFMMAVGEFEVIHDQWQNIPLTYYMESEYAPLAKEIFGNTPEMMSYFSNLFQYPYPWQKYAQIIVRDYVSGAMENTTATVFMDDLQSDSRTIKEENWDHIVAHELMHQWFGDLVTCESWSNLTLNEGFAAYSEYLWDEYKYGVNEADYRFMTERTQYIDDANETSKNLIRYYYDDREDMFDSHSYNKGALVLHMLRNYVGDEAFFASLHLYLKSNAYQAVEVADLRLAFESVTGEDLNWFFDQWYFSAGHPQLTVQHKFQNDTLVLHVNQVQQIGSAAIYRLPLYVDIWVGGVLQSAPIIVTDDDEVYKFPLSQKPDLVIFDAQHQLLAEISHPKSEEEMLYQFTHGERIFDLMEVLDSLGNFKSKKIVDKVLDLAFINPNYFIRQSAVEYLQTNEIKPKNYLEQLAILGKDSSGFVRGAVISYLAKSDFEKFRTEIYAALSDEFYSTNGLALTAILENGQTISIDTLEELKKSNNIRVIIPTAFYIIKNQIPNSYLWFVNKIEHAKSNDLFYLLQVFSEYLITLGTLDEKEQTIGLYENFARYHNNYIVRYAAYQSLFLISDVMGVQEKLTDIKSKETDQRLLDLYNGE